MPNAATPPLSSTVASVFNQFLKKLETDETLNDGARDALAQCLHGQMLDHETLRKALFKPDKPQK